MGIFYGAVYVLRLTWSYDISISYSELKRTTLRVDYLGLSSYLPSVYIVRRSNVAETIYLRVLPRGATTGSHNAACLVRLSS